MAKFALTTIDNPFNPFTQWDEWEAYDAAQGYHTNALLARIVVSSEEISEADQLDAIEEAIKTIVQENFDGIYIMVTPDQKIVPRILP